MKFIKCKAFQRGPLNDDGTHNIEDCEIIAERVWFFYDLGKIPPRSFLINNKESGLDVTSVNYSELYDIQCLCTAKWLASQIDGFIVVHIPDGRKCYINKEKITHLGVYDGMTKVYVGNQPIQCTDDIEEVKRLMEE